MTGFLVRLGAIAASTAWIFGLVELARYAGWPVGLGAGCGGVLLAAALAEDWAEVAVPAAVRSGSGGWRVRRPSVREDE